MNSKYFGKNLKLMLDMLDISQIELAGHTGLTPAAISQIISGKREPNLNSIIKILRIVPIKFERLVSPMDIKC